MLIFFRKKKKKNSNDNGFAKTLPAKYIFCHSRLPTHYLPSATSDYRISIFLKFFFSIILYIIHKYFHQQAITLCIDTDIIV